MIKQLTVRVKPYNYQLANAELEGPMDVCKPDDSCFTIVEAAFALLCAVNVVGDPDA